MLVPSSASIFRIARLRTIALIPSRIQDIPSEQIPNLAIQAQIVLFLVIIIIIILVIFLA